MQTTQTVHCNLLVRPALLRLNNSHEYYQVSLRIASFALNDIILLMVKVIVNVL